MTCTSNVDFGDFRRLLVGTARNLNPASSLPSPHFCLRMAVPTTTTTTFPTKSPTRVVCCPAFALVSIHPRYPTGPWCGLCLQSHVWRVRNRANPAVKCSAHLGKKSLHDAPHIPHFHLVPVREVIVGDSVRQILDLSEESFKMLCFKSFGISLSAWS